MKSLKEAISELKSVIKRPADEKEEHRVCFSIPLKESYKGKYNELQDATGKKFGRELQEVIELAIDSAYEDR